MMRRNRSNGIPADAKSGCLFRPARREAADVLIYGAWYPYAGGGGMVPTRLGGWFLGWWRTGPAVARFLFCLSGEQNPPARQASAPWHLGRHNPARLLIGEGLAFCWLGRGRQRLVLKIGCASAHFKPSRRWLPRRRPDGQRSPLPTTPRSLSGQEGLLASVRQAARCISRTAVTRNMSRKGRHAAPCPHAQQTNAPTSHHRTVVCAQTRRVVPRTGYSRRPERLSAPLPVKLGRLGAPGRNADT